MLPEILSKIGGKIASAVSSSKEKEPVATPDKFGFAGSAVGQSTGDVAPPAVSNAGMTPVSMPSVTSKDTTSLLQSTVRLLSKISGQLQQSLAMDIARARTDRENFLEHKNSQIANASAVKERDEGSGGGGIATALTATAIGAAVALALGSRQIANAINDSPTGKWLQEKAGKVREATYAVGRTIKEGAITVARKIGLLGDTVAKYESGKAGYGSISMGRGDPGGASYGKYQLASKTGTLQEFLRSSGYGRQFAGKTIGSAAFNQQWRNLAAHDANFGKSQHEFIAQKKYAPAIKYAAQLGFPVNDSRIQEMIWSGAIQHGGIKKILKMTADHPNFRNMSVEDIIRRYYMVREQYAVNAIRRNGGSAAVIRGVSNRMHNEVNDVLRMRAEQAKPGELKPAQTVSAKIERKPMATATKPAPPVRNDPAITQASKEFSRSGLHVAGVAAKETLADGKAIDVSASDRIIEANDNQLRSRFDEIARRYQKKGYIVLWNHKRYDPDGSVKTDSRINFTDRMHVEAPEGGVKPMITIKPRPLPRKPMPAQAANIDQSKTTIVNERGTPIKTASLGKPTVAAPKPSMGSLAYRVYFNTQQQA
jgi:hypothetical protein